MIPIPEPSLDSPTWPVVLAFAKLMEHKLALKRHKGNREGWMKDPVYDLCNRIGDEHIELVEALNASRGCSGESALHCVALEAADVANFAMMVADRVTEGKVLASEPNPGVSNNSQSGGMNW